MSYSRFLNARPETLSEDGIEGIIDLANLADRGHHKIESRPEAFLSLTYPTADIRRAVERLNDRFSRRPDAPALFLFEGLKGSGKSHVLVLAYHLLRNASQAGRWLAKHDLTLAVPPNVTVVAHKYTDRPLLRIWDFIFAEARMTIRGHFDVYPSERQVVEAIGDKHLIVILDELEQGIGLIPDEAIRRQNIAFLQMLSELGNRCPQVTIFASIYDAGKEPGATLIRVPSVRVQFARSTPADRAKVVLHRLFENFLEYDPAAVAGTVESLLNTWRRFIPTFDSDAFRSRIVESYPFHPELLTLILDRVPQRGGFQAMRGSLGFLANMVRMTHATEDVITAGHASLADRETTTRLQDLDPSGDLINRARGNMQELAQLPLAERLASATMLYTLTGEGRTRGATREELIRHVMLPGADINDFEQTLLAYRKYASHFHSAEGRFFFDLEENADAKVEFRSLTIDTGGTKARALLRTTWLTDVFKEAENAVVFTDPTDTKAALDSLRKERLRIVLAPRQLTPEDRHDLYFGLSVRNQVLLFEPKVKGFDLEHNPDLTKWAQRRLAAEELRDQANAAGESDRRDEYERIGREDLKHITDAIRKAGLLYSRFEAFGASAAADRVESDALLGATKEDALKYLSQQVHTVMVIQEHLRGRLDQIKGKLVKKVNEEYRETLTFPVPLTVGSVTRAVRELCKEDRIGIYHARGNYSGRDPELTDAELMEARIGEPVEAKPRPPQPEPPPVPKPPAGVVRIEVAPGGPVTCGVGEVCQLGVTGFDDDELTIPGIAVAWQSRNPDVASVSATGAVTALAPGQAEITALAGEIVSNAVRVVVSVGPAEQVAIPFKPSKGALRQEVAARLAEAEGAKVVSIRFQVYQEGQDGELSDFPAGLRGGLSGPGRLGFEITIAKQGDMSKAQVEQLCEQLPDFRAAQYSARLEVVRPVRQE